MRILVIEDELKVAGFIKRGLKEEGYAVDIASDGEEGHYYATTNDYDLIILDLMLPKMDGLTLCQELRKDNISIPIIILTAKDTVKDKVTGLDTGADDYLTKPFAFEELQARIRALLRKKNHQASTILQAADLTLNTVTHKAARSGREIPLTTKEYSLLEYLMRNADSVVTRTMISEHVWDINFDTFTNVIDVYINYLRNKIDKGHKKKLIHTLRGRGYILKKDRTDTP
ncbi:MAG: response regulator transcription factor [Candidatus Aureabacteria bacterium]|nr:response regulator transcription factor [Candidatus Auribacterota bacterium]